MLDPIPPINKIFSLISQEERQRNIISPHRTGGIDTANGMAFMAGHDSHKRNINVNSSVNRFNKRDGPFCTNCNIHGHTIAKCYKIHGYPSGYKSKQRNNQVVVNQLSNSTDLRSNPHQNYGESSSNLSNE